MNPYSSYKDSGVEWIGEIPSHWNSIKLKYIGFLYGGLSGKSGKDFNDDDNPNNKPFIPFTNICDNTYISKNNLGMVSISEDDKQNRVEKNDLFFLMSSEDQEGIGKPSVLKDDLGEVYLNTFCRGFRIIDEKYDSLFVNYLLSGHSYRELLSVEGRGFTRINLRSHKVSDFQIYYPPIETQTQIVSFLDTKTQKIDELIEKTEQKIELLKEKRTSLINHCVTKGLNPNVEMKDSGVEWIGEIPSGWGLTQLKYLSNKVGSGVTPRGGSDVYVDEGIPFLRSQNIHFQGLELDDVVYISEEIHEQMSSSKVLPNDVLFNITGGSIGRCFYTQPNSNEYNVNQHVCIIRPNQKVLTKFLYYCLYSDVGQIQVSLNNTGSGKEGLNFQNIKSFVLPNVNMNEQTQIVEYLDKQTQKIDSTIEKETQRIELLKEYRQSLISEVVTGKIDVRDWNE